MVVKDNMHIYFKVIEVTKINDEVRSDLQHHYHSFLLVSRAIAFLSNYSMHVRNKQGLEINSWVEKPCMMSTKCLDRDLS